MVSKLEETVLIDGEPFELSANQYPGSVHPRGFEYMTSFRLDPFPIWTYALGPIEVEKQSFVPHGRNAVVVTYKATSKKRGKNQRIGMTLRPLLSFVDYHHLRHQNP